MITSSGCATGSELADEQPGVPDPAGFPDPVARAALREFSIPYLYPYQRLVIANILEGVDQLVILPTGGGKSLCFQLPARLLPGLTVVVTPLLSLLADQLSRLRRADPRRGAPWAGALRGGQSREEREELLGREELRLLYATPESLAVPRTLERLKAAGVRHLVVDEAHCLSQWGRGFRPAYLGLGGLAAELRPAALTAFTATASDRVVEDIRELLFGARPWRLVRGNPDRPNLHYEVLPVLSRTRALCRLVGEGPRPALVFSRTRRGAEALARALRRRFPGEEISFYHAGLDAGERAEVEAWFRGSTRGVLVATSAYGLGVDKPDIRTLIHAEPPYSVEAYLQESGRAGRDGQRSRVVLLVGPGEEDFEQTLPSELERGLYRRMLEYVAVERQALKGGRPGRTAAAAGRPDGDRRARCRREFLARALGSETSGSEEPACAGCDVCDGTAARRPEGMEAILALVRRCNRWYTLRELAQVLEGRRTYEVVRKGLGRAPGFGLLRHWDGEDIAEALDAMVKSGCLSVPARGWWKNRVTGHKR